MKAALVGALSVVAVWLAMFAWICRPITLPYRLTVEVRVNGDYYIGSSVRAGRWRRNPNPMVAAEWVAVNRGEAMTINLGRFGPLFVVLNGRYFAWELPMMVYRGPAAFEDVGSFVRWASSPRPARDVPHADLPLMIRFRDITQPSTAECVDPDHMEASFPSGTSATLVRATIEIVDEGVTTGGIDKRLPWLALPRHERDSLMTGFVWRHWRPRVNDCSLLPEFFEDTN